MAWNRPNNEKAEKRGGGEHGNVHLKGLFAGAIVVVVGAVVLLYFTASRDSQVKRAKNNETPTSLIREVKPATGPQRPTTNLTASAGMVKQQQTRKEDEGPLFYTNKMGEVKRVQNKEGVVVHLAPRKKLFTHRSDVVISDILSVRPGELSYATIPSDFDELFAKSLLEKIEFSDDDTEEDRAKKERVIAARNELKERWKAGESAAQILRDEQKRLEKLAGKYEFYKGEVQNLRASGATPKEVAELVAAARIAMQNDDIKIGLSMNWDEHLALMELEKETGIIWQNK